MITQEEQNHLNNNKNKIIVKPMHDNTTSFSSNRNEVSTNTTCNQEHFAKNKDKKLLFIILMLWLCLEMSYLKTSRL